MVAAAVVAIVHMAVLAYIVFGGFLALRRLAWLWPSIAMTLWSAYVTLAEFRCPLTTLEKWESPEALAEHGTAAALQALSGKLEGKLTGAPSVTVLDALPAGDPDKGAL